MTSLGTSLGVQETGFACCSQELWARGEDVRAFLKLFQGRGCTGLGLHLSHWLFGGSSLPALTAELDLSASIIT